MSSQKLKKLLGLLYSCELCDHACRDLDDLDLHVTRKHIDANGHSEKRVGKKIKPESQKTSEPGCSTFSKLDEKWKIAHDNTVKVSSATMKKLGKSIVDTIMEGDHHLKTSPSGDSQSVDVSALETNKVWQQKKSSLKFTCNYCLRDFKSEISRHYNEQTQYRAKSGSLNTEKITDAAKDIQIIPDSDGEVERSKSYEQPLKQPTRTIQYHFERFPNITRIKVRHQKCYFLCTICKKMINRSDNAKLHSLTHSGERPFQCSYCKKNCKTKWELKEHENQHTGQKPFKCKYCFKGFFNHQGRYCHSKKCLAAQNNL